jgi:hypothetical protein
MKNITLTNFRSLIIATCMLLTVKYSNAQIQKGADIDGEAVFDYSGCSVSMPDANTLAIGGSGNDGNGTDAGHVRVYIWSGNAWVKKGVDIDGEASGDNIPGVSLSVSMPDANTVAIGGSGNDGNGTDAGHVRVYSIGSSIDVLENSVANTLEIYLIQLKM